MTTKTGSTLSRLVAETGKALAMAERMAEVARGNANDSIEVSRELLLDTVVEPLRETYARAPLYAALEEAARDLLNHGYTVEAADRLRNILKDLAALDAVEDSPE